jgi:hypothetical protein
MNKFEKPVGSTTSTRGTSLRSTSYMDRSNFRPSTPTPVVAFPWGSRSMTRTRSPRAARAALREMAVVVLPTPPFWLATAKILVGDDSAMGLDPASGCGDGRNGSFNTVWSWTVKYRRSFT